MSGEFQNAKSFQRAFKPGDRIYISGFRVADSGGRVTRNRPPVLAEVCCTYSPASEQDCRRKGWPAMYLIPVKPDGSLDFMSSVLWRHLGFYDDLQSAQLGYRDAVLRSRQTVRNAKKKAQAKFKKTEDYIDRVLQNINWNPSGKD